MMPPMHRFIEVLRNWYILLIGILIVGGSLVVASQFGSPPASSVQEVATGENGGKAPAEPQQAAKSDKPASKAPAATKTAQAPKAEQPAPAKAPTPQPQQAAKSSPPAKATQSAQAPAKSDQPAPPAAKQPSAAAKSEPQAQTKMPANEPAPRAQSSQNVHGHGAPAATGAAPDGDVAAGRQAFNKCQACHSIDVGRNLIGPSLAGVVGRPAAQVDGYNYSPAMKNSGVTWDAAALDSFLIAPQKFVPKNKMAFPGLRSESERKNVIAYLASTSGGTPPAPVAQQGAAPTVQRVEAPPARPTPRSAESQQPDTGVAAGGTSSVSYIPDQRITLRSGIAEGRMVYIGVGGTIDGQVNPILSAVEGQVVQITLLNGEGAEHDVVFPDQNAASPRITGRGTSTILVFRATKAGDFVYYCSVAGHREAGMEGQFLVSPRPPENVAVEADIAHLPTDVPAPIGKRDPKTTRVDLLAVELEARLAEGTTYGFWTFNGRVPGPMLRARVGDTLDVHVHNSEDSAYIHSVDFHAATGPGGGAASTQVEPGHAKSFKFKALLPGLYVYHCATPMVAHHITNGMYGMILVEPEDGLPPVDREFYVMQGEIYTDAAFGQQGRQEFSVEKLLNERPEYFVFNGSVGALSQLHPLKAKVGETVRIFFGVGGPNFTSSFHVIGEIFDRVYSFADLVSPPLRGVQTVTVPPGGAVMVEFKVDVPGNYILVDHALSRAERGLVGILQVEGEPNPEIFDGKVEEGSGH